MWPDVYIQELDRPVLGCEPGVVCGNEVTPLVLWYVVSVALEHVREDVRGSILELNCKVQVPKLLRQNKQKEASAKPSVSLLYAVN